MYIICPICCFERHLADDAIPENASVASCPKCGSKFRIREPRHADFIPGVILTDEQHRRMLADRAVSAQKSGLLREHPQSGDEARDAKDAAPSDAVRGTHPDPGEKAEERPLSVLPDDGPAPQKSGGRSEGPLWMQGLDPQAEDDVPWEHPDRYGLLGGFWRTIVRVMFHPQAFFGSFGGMNISPLRPALFYAIMGLLQTIMSRIWSISALKQLHGTVSDPQAQQAIQSMIDGFSTPMVILLTPFIMIFQLALFAAFFHLMIRLAKPENADFGTTLRVIAYSSAPTILCVVPMLGNFIGLVWFIAAIFIGIRYAHRLSPGKALMVTLPGFIMWFAIGVLYAGNLVNTLL